MKKIFSKIHLWLSVPFGLLITLICFSGAMLVFETEVMELCRRDLYYVEKAGPAPLPMSRLAEKVAATLPDSVSVTGITASSNPERAWQVNLSKPRRASVYVDQYTGEVKGRYERAPFFMTMFRLHRWLLDSMKPDGSIFWGNDCGHCHTDACLCAAVRRCHLVAPYKKGFKEQSEDCCR